MSTTVAPAVGMMVTSSAVKILSPGLGGETSGFRSGPAIAAAQY